jgi:hypothetical protein
MLATDSRLMRVVLVKREILPVPAEFRRLRVRSGRVWLTMDGRDVTLSRGQEVGLRSKSGKPVVSPLGELPVVVELLGNAADAADDKARRMGGSSE